jgi:carboxymethylenebutenolidase
VQGKQVGAIGFSMGAAFALVLHDTQPDALGAITLFYGGSDMDLSIIGIPLLCHFAEIDEFESFENVEKMAIPKGVIHLYPGTKHWFFEDNRPEFDQDAATLAWDRTLAFFNETLS